MPENTRGVNWVSDIGRHLWAGKSCAAGLLLAANPVKERPCKTLISSPP